MRVGIVAGEPSGDVLGAALIRALRSRMEDVEFEGVGGPQMIAEGCRSLFPLERLSVMGLTEILLQLPGLLRIRRRLVRHFLEHPPDVFLGIDAPDFNLPLERRMRRAGILSCHFVSPTVWAWRQGRIRGIRRSVDLMLTMFPFEADFYREHGVPVQFVGHPLADQIDLLSPRAPARDRLGVPQNAEVLVLMPGSRRREVEAHASDLLDTARWLKQRRPNLIAVAPAPNESLMGTLRSLVSREEDWIRLLVGDARTALTACDIAVVASGTATMEAALIGRPFLAIYRVSPFSHFLFRHMLKVPWIAMPNIYAGRELAPEFHQDRVRPDLLGPAVEDLLRDVTRGNEALQAFARMHGELRRGAASRAAEAIQQLVEAHLRSSIDP